MRRSENNAFHGTLLCYYIETQREDYFILLVIKNVKKYVGRKAFDVSV